ncbi:MAG: NlpC/P60 family protein [Sterolibacterium sp.]
MTWVANYVGMPFVDGGRDRKGCDCWGLVRLIYQNELKIELPSYGEISATDLVSIRDAMVDGRHNVETWVPVVGTPKEFDVVVMAWAGRNFAGHVGIAIDGLRLIHTEKGVDAAIVPMKHMSIKHRILGVYRHRSMAA